MLERDVVNLATQGAVGKTDVFDRARALARFRGGDRVFHGLTFAAAAAVLVLLGGVIVSLVIGSIPAAQEFGFRFLWTESWNPVTDKYGAGAAIFGTVVTSVIAMAIAIPVGLGIAIFLSELCPQPLRQPIGIAIELLAGIPSIIYGIWGLFIFAPLVQTYVEPGVIAFLGPCRDSTGVRRAALRHRRVHRRLHPGDHGAALHLVDVARRVRHRAAGPQGIGLRARLHHPRGGRPGRDPLHAHRHHRRRHAGARPRARRDHGGDLRHRQRAPISGSILAPGTTISATIANEFTEAVGDLYTSALIELGLILFLITFVVLAVARYLLMRIERKGRADMSLYAARRRKNGLYIALCYAASAFGLIWLAWILGALILKGGAGLVPRPSRR